MFQEGKLKAGDKKTIIEFSERYVVSEKLVADYIDLLTDIEMRKDKRQTDLTNGKRIACTIEFFAITAEIHARSLVKFYCQYADRHMNLKFM